MELHVIVDDYQRYREYLSEHGLSLFFRYNSKTILFDAGQSDIFIYNAKKKGLDISNIDFVAFSHGHYDHTGGINSIPLKETTRIYLHPDALLPKYSGNRYIGMPQTDRKKYFILRENYEKLADNIIYLGYIPRKKNKPLGYTVFNGKMIRDYLRDDTALVIKMDSHIIILAGCSHSGIHNIVAYADRFYPGIPKTLIGGFHMHNYTEEEIIGVVERLSSFNVEYVYPGHCTGAKATKYLLSNFEGEKIYSGMTIDL